ncbi:hypothetical protein [Micromonospora sediminimaris]|uniref:Uncharacterized protein n=1 Tax=Micromonospora sediminimaris TaxID=547162 RepID=A0A9W5XL46_9ACTN|nr:hypothetical protein [Micromonospora sediminimaris]GIJ33378.1 hypothetical protein Vse01_25260 [Micromonospora sediminimaris]SFC80907.1 hypothetical protein SAMN05216284_107240 [Micromonospora sediminimaris]
MTGIFPAVQLTRCFPEAHGFVLLDPARLDQHLGANSTGRDLLELFSTTEAGDTVTRAGIALPLTGVTAGYYTVLVRHAVDRSPWSTAAVSSPGWILGSVTGSLLLCGLGHLRHWTPDHSEHRRVAVPPGWYEIEVRAHPHAEGSDDGTYEFVLTPTPTQPAFRADPTRQLAIL